MMAVPFQEQAALPGCAGRVEAADRLILSAEYSMLAIHGKPALVVHEDGAYRSKRDERR